MHKPEWQPCRIPGPERFYPAAGISRVFRGGVTAPNQAKAADSGSARVIPAGIRNAVILRDRKCRWAGGCDQPASACDVHHTKHKADGGKTSTKDCVLLCTYHHQIAIHRQGWTLVLNPDGTTTAWNKDKTGTRPKSCTATDPRSARGEIPRGCPPFAR